MHVDCLRPFQDSQVLIVDDEPHNRELLETMLAPEGFRIHTASSGEAALALVAEQPPDLILLDVMMPGMDGYQVATHIKGNRKSANIPIIMVTALDDGQSRMFGLSAGAEDFLTKPVNRQELCMRVKNLLRLKSYADYHDHYSQVLEGEVTARAGELRYERDRAQRYLDTAGSILMALDKRGRITLINRYACSTLGWPAEELLGLDWVETCVPRRLWGAIRDKFQALVGGDLPIYDSPVVTRHGVERLIEWHNTIVHDETGAVTGTLSSGTDITERTAATHALQAAEERTRFALDAANVGIWEMDCATNTVRLSMHAESQYGLPPGTFSGSFEKFIELVHPDDRNAMADTVSAAMRSGADFSSTHRARWADGTVRWISGTGRFLLTEQGDAMRGMGISQDVTDSRRLQEQYQQAQKMDTVGQLASGVAHDFNNLLTVILGFTEILSADRERADDHARGVAEITLAATRAATLTKQLLAFGRQQVMIVRPLDVNSLVLDMGGMLGRLIGEQVTIRTALAVPLSPALADRGQIEQAVMNLVVNARDAMPRGGTVTIETAEVDLEDSPFHEEPVTAGRYVMIAVGDTGTGMTSETRRRLFEPFFTTKDVGKGTGLGLSTVYGIVKQSKGYIWVYSELGSGTTFKLYLPRSEDAVEQVLAVPVPGSNPTRATETVLLVEDEGGVRRLASRLLSNAGYQVLEATNGLDAEMLFAKHAGKIDLVMTDVVMPECGGPELVGRLRRHAPNLRVLYMSGYSEQAAREKSGIHGLPFIQKPFTSGELQRQVRSALDV